MAPRRIGGDSVRWLNTAIHRWVRRTIGGPAGGTGENVDAFRRKQFNIKIDHHFNQNHTLTGSFDSGIPLQRQQCVHALAEWMERRDHRIPEGHDGCS